MVECFSDSCDFSCLIWSSCHRFHRFEPFLCGWARLSGCRYYLFEAGHCSLSYSAQECCPCFYLYSCPSSNSTQTNRLRWCQKLNDEHYFSSFLRRLQLKYRQMTSYFVLYFGFKYSMAKYCPCSFSSVDFWIPHPSLDSFWEPYLLVYCFCSFLLCC